MGEEEARERSIASRQADTREREREPRPSVVFANAAPYRQKKKKKNERENSVRGSISSFARTGRRAWNELEVLRRRLGGEDQQRHGGARPRKSRTGHKRHDRR